MVTFEPLGPTDYGIHSSKKTSSIIRSRNCHRKENEFSACRDDEEGENVNMREKIIEQYIQLSLEKRTAALTVQELSRYMGISRTTFYKYFRDCYDIAEQIFISEIIEPVDVMFQNHLDNNVIVENWYLSFYKRKEFYIYAIRDDSQNSLFFTIIRRLQDYNRRLFSCIYSGDDLEYISYLYASSQAMLTRKWLMDGMRIDHRKIASYYLKMCESEHIG